MTRAYHEADPVENLCVCNLPVGLPPGYCTRSCKHKHENATQQLTANELTKCDFQQQKQTKEISLPLSKQTPLKMIDSASTSGYTAPSSDSTRPPTINTSQSTTTKYDALHKTTSRPAGLCLEDEIGVTLDYEFPGPSAYEYSDVTAAQRRRNNRQQRHDVEEQQQQQQESMGLFEFYRKHWFGQFSSGIFTGLIFMSVGFIFIIYFQELPTYIGVMFVLVSFPPCCLAVNRWAAVDFAVFNF